MTVTVQTPSVWANGFISDFVDMDKNEKISHEKRQFLSSRCPLFLSPQLPSISPAPSQLLSLPPLLVDLVLFMFSPRVGVLLSVTTTQPHLHIFSGKNVQFQNQLLMPFSQHCPKGPISGFINLTPGQASTLQRSNF